MVENSRSEEKLWFDKYIPMDKNSLTFHPETTKILMELSQKDDFPHMIFYGPEGSGKKTRIRIFLSEIFGNGIFKISNETKIIKYNSVNIEFSVLSSNYHIGKFYSFLF
jgi:replication factor C subunit 3/5